MEQARYTVALLLVVFAPGILFFWFSIHPFIRFWRKVGPFATLAIHYSLVVILAAVVFRFRRSLLSVEFGTNPILLLLAIPMFILALILRGMLSKELKIQILTGLPELAPYKYQSRLLTEGIYSRMRHPRYVQIALALLAYALFANYLASYLVFLLSVIGILLVVRVEEKELRDRFGAEYNAYSGRVPRFLPKL